MTDFLINDDILTQGEMTIQQQAVNNQIHIVGVMELNMYIEDIKTIATEIFYIAGVEVTKEIFGTNDKKVVYEFTGKGFGVDTETLNNKLKGEQTCQK